MGDETGSATLDEFFFNQFAGETAARSVTLGDDGTVAFLGLTPDGDDPGSSRDSAVFRAHVVASGSKYFWSGEAGNNQWFGKSGKLTNWKDENGVNWSDPPGTHINNAIVTIDPPAPMAPMWSWTWRRLISAN